MSGGLKRRPREKRDFAKEDNNKESNKKYYNIKSNYFNMVEGQSNEQIDVDDFTDKELLNRIVVYFGKNGKEHYSEKEVNKRIEWLKKIQCAEIDCPDYD